DRGAAVPLLTPIGGLKDYARVANNGASVCIAKGYRIETVRALRKRVRCLLNPGGTTIGSSQDYAGAAEFEPADRSVIRVGERNAIESFGRSARLSRRGAAAVPRTALAP